MPRMQAADEYALLLCGAGIPYEPEHRGVPGRRFRFDFAFPEHMLAVEIDGGTWVQGRHNRPKGYAKDCEKLNLAVLHGWRVLRFTADQVRDGTALRMTEQALNTYAGGNG